RRSARDIRAAAALAGLAFAQRLSPDLGTESLQTPRWRELDSKFQFLDLGRAFFTRSGAFNPATPSASKAAHAEQRPGARPEPRRCGGHGHSKFGHRASRKMRCRSPHLRR